jgi:N-acylneuraminate cytidylyltransferase
MWKRSRLFGAPWGRQAKRAAASSQNEQPPRHISTLPTSPFRKSESIDRAVEKILEYPQADSLRSVTPCSEHPYKMWVTEGEYLVPFVKSEDKNIHTLSYHLLPTVYIQNASIYITKPKTIREKKSPTGDIIVPFIMDESESVDVNNPLDFELAETIVQKMA